MASKLVAVVDTNSSKADEVAALHKMAQCAAQGSYLASLLTPQLLDWVQGQIEMDLPPDIMGERGFQADKRRELMTEVSSLRKQLADADRKAGWAARKVEHRHRAELAQEQGAANREAREPVYWRGAAHLARDKAAAYRSALTLVWGLLQEMMDKRDEAE